jgi:large subunit ribosomal protein L13
MSTPSIKKDEIERQWLLIDADGQVLGRLASQIATLLKGKHKPQYTPHADTGDYVVVINAAKVKLTGAKLANKMYYQHSGYVGGLKTTSAGELQATKPEALIENAVRRMISRNPLGRKMMSKLHVYAGAEHNQVAQKPEPFELQY